MRFGICDMKDNKKFDCVGMMHDGARKSQIESSNLTLDQQLEYWQQKTVALKKYKEMLKKKTG